jgi:hypothetical protein
MTDSNILINVHKRYRDLPSVQTPLKAVDIRKSTESNLSNLLNLLISVVSTRSAPYSNDLIGAISSFFDHVILMAELDAPALISDLKEAYSVYLEWVRGGILPTNFSSDFRFMDSSSYSETQRALRPLLVLQYRLFGSLTFSPESKEVIDVAVACLSAHRVIAVATKPNYSSITTPSKGTYNLESLKGEIRTVLKDFFFTPDAFRERLLSRARKWSYIVSMKGGPNGKAIMTCTADARAIGNNPDILDHFYNVANFMGLDKLYGTLLVMSKTASVEGTPQRGDPVLGRLHGIEEWGGKCRIVAIVDYWTQTLLRPLHLAIGDFLKQMGPDAAYDQDKAATRVRAWSKMPGSEVFCFDLTTATDRLPVEIQEYILGVLLGNATVANHWRNLLTARKYWTVDNQELEYAVGQPMGALSSFAMFDLTHHVLVQIAARRCKFSDLFTDYVVIGDDIAINSRPVAEAYRKLMTELGLELNLAKSVLHTEGLLRAGEIAKRLFIEGTEISCLPVKLFAKLPRFGKLAPVVQEFMGKRGALPIGRELLVFLTGCTDTESMKTLLKLNAVPGQVSGLSCAVGALAQHLNIEHWIKNLPLSNSDILDAYTYVTITEQLKRLDALLRESNLISQLIRIPVEEDAGMMDVFSGGREDLRRVLAKFWAQTPSLDRRHPLVTAAYDEARRVSRTLSGLRAGTLSLSEVARRGLLDSLRNSVWTSMDLTDEEQGQALYSVFSGALVALGRMAGTGDSKMLEFTIPLLSLSRSYTVTWRLGRGVFVNSVRSKVVVDKAENETSLDNLLRSTSAIDQEVIDRQVARRSRRTPASS